jgi:hypothetical protein
MLNNTAAIIIGVILSIISIVGLIWASGIGRSNADVVSGYTSIGGKLRFKNKKIKKH